MSGGSGAFFLIIENGIPVKPTDGCKDFTLTTPFEKDDLLVMKTVNDIEWSVLTKLAQS